MENEQKEPRLRVALASYDVRELRVNGSYFAEYGGFSVCKGYQYGRQLLADLEAGAGYDVILLDDALRDMDAVEFTAAFYRTKLLQKPVLLLLSSRGRLENQDSVLNQGVNYCIIKPYRLSALTKEIQMLCELQTSSLRSFCTQLYMEWGVRHPSSSCDYLTEAVQIALGSARKLAIRKEILLKVGEKNGLSIAAVDSGIRRLIQELDEQGTAAWYSFKRENGCGAKRLTTGKLIYAVREAVLQYDIQDEQEGGPCFHDQDTNFAHGRG